MMQSTRAANPLTWICVSIGALIVVAAAPTVLMLPVLILGAVGAWLRNRTRRPSIVVATVAVVLLVLVDLALGGPIGRVSLLVARVIGLAIWIALAISLVDRRNVVRDLERRGVSRAIAFRTLLLADIATSTRERVPRIAAAQKARGANIDRGLGARWRGRLAIISPLVAGLVRDVDQRTLALEARGFHRPGIRDLPWAPADSSAQRLLRPAVLVLALLAVIGGAWLGLP